MKRQELLKRYRTEVGEMKELVAEMAVLVPDVDHSRLLAARDAFEQALEQVDEVPTNDLVVLVVHTTAVLKTMHVIREAAKKKQTAPVVQN